VVAPVLTFFLNSFFLAHHPSSHPSFIDPPIDLLFLSTATVAPLSPLP
jgi:hypothetical protein